MIPRSLHKMLVLSSLPCLWFLSFQCQAFTPQIISVPATSTTSPSPAVSRQLLHSQQRIRSGKSTSLLAYTPPTGEDRPTTVAAPKPPLYPKAGDFVRYFDLDGGKADGEILVGKIRFISPQLSNDNDDALSRWTVELTPLENVGDGYWAEYGSRQKFMKGTVYRPLAEVSPVTASFVRSEDAYKVPLSATGAILVKQDQYDGEGYEGPENIMANVDPAVLEADEILYQDLKGRLLRFAAIAGAAGTLVADLTRGTEAAAIYFGGFAASLLYLVFLSIKTDTIGTAQTNFGKNLSSLRFAMPIVVLTSVALYNQQVAGRTTDNIFSTVTPEQFAAAIIGFLTYRLPLLLIQIEAALKGEAVLPGSAGMAMQLAMQNDEDALSGALLSDAGTTVFLISGPQATGRSQLVQQLLEQGDGKFVTPALVDRMTDGATFDRLEQRDEFLSIDGSGRYGLTKQAILDAAKTDDDTDDEQSPAQRIIVVDADVELAKKLSTLSGLRLVGVWVGLGSVAEFETRVGQMVDRGELLIEDGETRESTIRNKIREIVKEIEFGISSGVFEFTVLNDDLENTENTLKQLQAAAKYVEV